MLLHLVKILVLFLSVSVISMFAGSVVMAASDPGGVDGSGTTGSSTAGGSTVGPDVQETGDKNCPKADTEPGIAYVCGYLRSSRIERMNPGDPTSPIVTGKPVQGATIATYEALPTSSGKNVDIANWGLGGDKIYYTSSDSSGYFKVKMRMQGPAANLVYPVVLCDGKVGGISRVDSMFSISDVFYVNCPSKLTFQTPPDILKDYVSESDRNTVLQCNTPLLDAVEGSPGYKTGTKSIGYTDKSVEQFVDAVLYEEQFDIRYAVIGGGGLFPKHEEGAWWSWDCVRRPDKKCFTEYDIPPGPGQLSEPKKVTHDSAADLDTSLINLSASDSLYANMVDYVTSNILDTLPLRSSMNLYRRFELRENPTNLLQFEKAPASYLQTMFGGVASTITILVRGLGGTEQLVSCENFKNAGKVMGVPGIINSQTAGVGPAIGTSSPYQWEKMYQDLTPDMLALPVCSHNGSPVTLGQIQPFKDTPGSFALNYEYFNPIFLLDKGGGAMGRTADSNYDSITSGDKRSDLFQVPAKSEANSPDKTPSNVILPEDVNHLSSVVAASTAATKDAYVTGGALTDGLKTPFKDDYSYDKGKVIWDWGASVKALCSKPAYNTAGVDVVDNDFKAVAGDQRKTDTTPSTQIFYTPISLLRDKLLKNAGSDPGTFLGLSKDTIDSYLSTFEASDNKIEMDATNWTGPFAAFFGLAGHTVEGTGDQKSFYQRKNLGTPIPHNIPLKYSLDEKSFPSIFHPGNMNESMGGNISGTGGTGNSASYPWKESDCNVWGNQYKDDPAACNADPQCLRTCRLNITNDYQGCVFKWKEKTCSPSKDGMTCNCNESEQTKVCSSDEKFKCVLEGKNKEQNPSSPHCNCLGSPGSYEENSCSGGEEKWCAVEQAGPYTEVIGLNVVGSPNDLMRSFHSTQEPVNPGIFKGTQTPIEPILSSSNLMVQTWASPFAGVKSYEGLGCVDYESTKNAETGAKRMWCKDTPRIGDAGTSSALLAIAAGPMFPDNSEVAVITYDTLAPTNRLYAGPVFAVFPSGDPCASFPDGVCDLKPSTSVDPMPAKVTIEDVQARSKPECAVTSCSLDVGAGLEDPIPTSLKQILNAAGSDWNAPAEVILAFMYAEGYFAKSPTGEWLMYDWTEPNILAWSLPVEGTIVKKNFTSPCDDLNWGEQGAPSMFISDWDDPNRSACASPDDSSLKCGIEKLVTGRGRYARRCNLLDSAYGLAKAAAEAAGLPGSCSWSPAQKADALGGFTGGDPNALPGSPYYNKMESILDPTVCH